MQHQKSIYYLNVKLNKVDDDDDEEEKKRWLKLNKKNRTKPISFETLNGTECMIKYCYKWKQNFKQIISRNHVLIYILFKFRALVL